MVGPVGDEQRSATNRTLTVGFVLVVAVSAGMIALLTEPTPAQLVGAVAGGLAVGVVLAGYVARMLREFHPG